MIPALLKWVGNKQKVANEIISAMPLQFNNYYEPFLGSGSVLIELLNKRYNNEFPFFNNSYAFDALPFLIDIFNSVKDNPNDLIKYYNDVITEYYDDPLSTYNRIRDNFNQNHNAFDFCILSRTCYSGIIRFRKRDGYMSTPIGPHKPIAPEKFAERVNIWSKLIKNTKFQHMDFKESMALAKPGDLIYCDPPYTHSQSILYGAQDFNIDELFDMIDKCKKRGVYVMLSINGTRESKKKQLSVLLPDGLFEQTIFVNCGTSMIDRLQNSGQIMNDELVHDRLLLTWK